MAKYILKRFSYTKSALIGAGIGSGVGVLGYELSRKRRKKRVRKIKRK